MARMLRSIDSCPKPVIALAHGAAIGGGVGLVAAADIALAAEGTVFSLAEVRLGILPSVISPYVLRAIGPRQARDLFLTGDRFDAREAHRIGLVHAVVPREELESAGRKKVESLLSSGPEAVAVAKRLIEEVTGKNPEEVLALTARTIAERRASAEAKEGLTAFLEKRAPSWTRKDEGSNSLDCPGSAGGQAPSEPGHRAWTLTAAGAGAAAAGGAGRGRFAASSSISFLQK